MLMIDQCFTKLWIHYYTVVKAQIHRGDKFMMKEKMNYLQWKTKKTWWWLREMNMCVCMLLSFSDVNINSINANSIHICVNWIERD